MNARLALNEYRISLPDGARKTLKDYLDGTITDRAGVRGVLNEVIQKVRAEGGFSQTSCDAYTAADPDDKREYTREGDYEGEARNCVAPGEPTAPTPPFENCWSGSCHPFSGWHWTAWGPVHSDATFIPARRPARDANIRLTEELSVRDCQSFSPDGHQESRVCYDLTAADLRDGRFPSTAEILKKNGLPESVPGNAPEYVEARLGDLYAPCLALGALARAASGSNQNEAVASFAGPNAGREDKLDSPAAGAAEGSGSAPVKDSTASSAI